MKAIEYTIKIRKAGDEKSEKTFHIHSWIDMIESVATALAHGFEITVQRTI